jgi:hypothetical protein
VSVPIATSFTHGKCRTELRLGGSQESVRTRWERGSITGWMPSTHSIPNWVRYHNRHQFNVYVRLWFGELSNSCRRKCLNAWNETWAFYTHARTHTPTENRWRHGNVGILSPHHLSMKTSRLKNEEIGWLQRYSSTQKRAECHSWIVGHRTCLQLQGPFPHWRHDVPQTLPPTLHNTNKQTNRKSERNSR